MWYRTGNVRPPIQGRRWGICIRIAQKLRGQSFDWGHVPKPKLGCGGCLTARNSGSGSFQALNNLRSQQFSRRKFDIAPPKAPQRNDASKLSTIFTLQI